VKVRPFFVAHAQPPELIEPRQRPLHHPAPSPQSATMFCVALPMARSAPAAYCEKTPALNQAVEASFCLAGRRSGGSSIDEDGIFLVFLIHSAARCSASSSCSMVIDLLTWFLARVICSLACDLPLSYSL